MRKFVSFFLFFVCLFAEELEVRLVTRTQFHPVFLSGFPEEVQSVLEFDLNTGGFCAISEIQEKARYHLSASSERGKIHVTVRDTKTNTSYSYVSIALDRQSIHEFSDVLHHDLFGSRGIAGQKILYTQRKKNEEGKGLDFLSEVWVCDSDGANARQLTFENSYCLAPAFFPGGKEFFYASEKSGQSKIYRAALADPKPELLIEMRGNQALPSLAQSGSQLAFITDIAGRPDLFVQNLRSDKKAQGKPRQLFSAPRATQATSSYSPDGKQIAFVSDKDGPPRIYILSASAKEGKPRLLTKKNRENTSPSWSPDGTKLAYSARTDGVRQIWIYDFVKEEEVQLTTGTGHKENPSWAPDSFHLLFNTESEEMCDLYLVHLNGGDPVLLHKQARFGSWEPRAKS